MLRELAIRDYAIIESLDLDFDAGLTVLTGETGAGKSILIDALGLVLGDRADTGAVRQGAERAEIVATLEHAHDPGIQAWLRDHDLDTAECILRRVVGTDGRSRGYINGTPVPLTAMRELGERLVDIHGQHEHQSLLRRDAQLALIDAHGGHDALIDEVARTHADWHEVDSTWRALKDAAADRADRLELLRFQVRELDALGLGGDELEGLDAEHARLANAGKLIEAAQRAAALTDGDDAPHVRGMLQEAVNALDDVAEHDPTLAQLRDMFAQAQILVGEGADDLNRWLDRFEIDPERKAWVEERIGTAHQLARKHHVTPDELPALHQRLRDELESLDQIDDRLAALETRLGELAAAYRERAGTLSAARAATAASIGDSVTAAMQTLGMPGGEFAAVMDTDESRFAAGGFDRVEFHVTANPGQALRPLVKVASGGELSRISLALQVTAANAATIGCLIFDEVDAGIGGAVAGIVGRELRRLADGRQVLCVTHLPQVAAQAHHHYRVDKKTVRGATRTHIEALEDAGRVDELARMLGGLRVTDKVRATAKEMLKN